MKVKVVQSCLTFFDPMDYRIIHARILEWVAVPFSRESSQPRDQTQVSCVAGRFFTVWVTGEALVNQPANQNPGDSRTGSANRSLLLHPALGKMQPQAGSTLGKSTHFHISLSQGGLDYLRRLEGRENSILLPFELFVSPGTETRHWGDRPLNLELWWFAFNYWECSSLLKL